MHAITKDQHSTLLRWACTVGSRPGKRAKRFLLADKGLSAEQIDTWWDNAVARASRSGNRLEVPLPAATAEDRQWQYAHLVSNSRNITQKDPPPSIRNDLFNAKDADVISQLPCLPQHPQHHLSFASSSTGSSSFSSSSAYGRSSSILSFPSEYWDYTPSQDCSPMLANASSGLTDTETPSLSFCELLSGNCGIATGVQSGPYISLVDVATNPNYSDIEHLPGDASTGDHASTADPAGHSELKCHELSNQHQGAKALSASSRTPSKTDTSQKAEKAPGRFICTACHLRFTTKGDWKRHEGSQCEPQTFWICMLGNNPAIPIDGGWLCTFCDLVTPGPDRTGILRHLEKDHKFHLCIRKTLTDRSFKRKDKLKHHLQRVHNLSEGSAHWEKWHQGATTQDKSAWGCGFCGACLFTWDGRLEHIGTHYETHHRSSLFWSHSHVIKGLLKQPYPEFNVSEAWRALVDPEKDPLLEWSREDAAVLKDKLEFRKGTPRELALEARRLAKPACRNADAEMDDLAWDESSPGSSRAMSRSASALGRNWAEPSSLSSPTPSAPKPTSQLQLYTAEANWKEGAAWPGGFAPSSDRAAVAADLEMQEAPADGYI